MKKNKINNENVYGNSNSNNLATDKIKINSNERVLVFIRIRPFIKNEIEYDNSSFISKIDKENNSMICKKI